MIWRNPIAWLGLATLLIPIAIHLLVRQQADTRTFPTLRFILPSRLAAIRRRFITDWLLLSIRLALLALAVAALADPFWQTASRRAAWSNRIARAIVVDTSASARGDAPASMQPDAANPASATASAGNVGAAANGANVRASSASDARPNGQPPDGANAGATAGAATERARGAAQQEAASAFRSTTFEASALADGIRLATEWLRSAPPARREIVVLSDFQLGALDASMLSNVPPHVGLRFVRTSTPPATRTIDGAPSTLRADTPRLAAARATAATMTSAAKTPTSTPATDSSHEPGIGFGLRTPRVTLNPTDTTVAWSSSVAGAGRGSETIASSRAAMMPGAALRAANDDLILEPFGVRLHATAANRAAARAAAEAVLATGIAMPASLANTSDAANAAGVASAANAASAATVADVARGRAVDSPSAAHPVAIIIAGPQDGEALPRDAARLASPWMSDVLNRVMNDRELAQAIAQPSAQSAARSAQSAAGSTQSAGAAAGTTDAAAPWITVARDAHGRPALLAAARARTGNGPGAAPGSGSAAAAVAPANAADARGVATSASSSATELVLVSRAPAADATTALLIRATLRALGGSDPLLEAEVMTLPDATLAQWQRPATDPPPAEWQDLDSSDRRWLWTAVLLLLALEQFLRRSRHRHTDTETEAAYEHAA
jgi:hypothetical protein